MIKLFNSMSREKEIFNPIVQGQVKMYVCGVTVYDHSHIGHARSAVVFDMVARHFRFRGFNVTMVKNFTDIDDKIIKRSKDDRIPWVVLTQRFIDEYHQDMSLLNVQAPSHEPKATEHIDKMIQMIQILMDKKFAYFSGGDVYYRVEAFKTYGRLSRRDLSTESAGVRVEVSELKGNPLDFVLWKSSKPGEPSWNSPWGEGRPGWHIECSAMAISLLGETFDIHGGGEDLLFPHHENEIAQSEGSTGKKFVNYWIHNGFVTVNHEKMSKSLGNFFTIKEIFEKYAYPPEVMGETLRFFLLSTHYRQPIQFSDQAIDEAKNGLDRFYDLLKKCKETSKTEKSKAENLGIIMNEFRRKFEESMDDDFNTPEALAALHTFRYELNKIYHSSINNEDSRAILKCFSEIGEILGLFYVSPEKWQFRKTSVLKEGLINKVIISDMEIGALTLERIEAKKKKDFKRADQIREDLFAKGIILEDHADGTTTWKR